MECQKQVFGESKFEIYKQGKPIIGYLKQIEFENTNNTLLQEILKPYENIIKLENKINNFEKQSIQNYLIFSS